jgi:hypothetical protein
MIQDPVRLHHEAKEKLKKLNELNLALQRLAMRTKVKTYMFAILLILLLIVFSKTLIAIFTILVMVVLAALVALHKRFTIVSLGVELYTFFAIVLTYVFGPLIASVSTIVMIALGDFLAAREPVYTFAKFLIYPLLCILTAFLSSYDIVVVGMIIVILMNLVFWFVWGILSQFSFFWGPLTIVVNCVVNYFLLSRMAEWLVQILGG